MKEIEELIQKARVSSLEAQSELYKQVYALAHVPEKIAYFAQAYLDTHQKSSTLFDAVLSFLPEEDFKRLVEKALVILRQGTNENAESVIAYASMQLPALLHPHLEEIYQLAPNQDTYYEEYPWRNSGKASFAFLEAIFNDPSRHEEYYKAWSCLLQTRDRGNIEYAISQARQKAFFPNYYPIEENIDNHLSLVGMYREGEQIFTFCNPTVYHLVFPSGYFSFEIPVWLSKENHPSWNLPAPDGEYRLGGVLESDSSVLFHHILTLDPIPQGVPVESLKRLVLGVHLTQIYNDALFYEHDLEGNPRPLYQVVAEEDDYPKGYIVETKVQLGATPNRWLLQGWGLSNSRENLFRVGGEPAWIQSPDLLTCPRCGKKMQFLMQIDSGLPDEKGEEMTFGDSGIIYVFWCDTSRVSGFTFQCA